MRLMHRPRPHNTFSRFISLVLAVALSGCATSVPYVGAGPHPQLERGAPMPPVDLIGNVLILPMKLLLWDWRVANHVISQDTEGALVKYLEIRQYPLLSDTKFRLNQYHPVQDIQRLIANKHVAWPYRIVLGIPVTLLTDVLLPGRLFPWGDYYNPYTNTVHLYSDHPAIALHEAGHAQDFSERRYKGTYALARLVPGVNLFQEFQATDEAIEYLIETGDRESEFRSYKILYPAYGTYIGSYLLFPFGLLAVLFGHVHGRMTAGDRKEFYQRLDSAANPTITGQTTQQHIPAMSSPAMPSP